MRRRKGIAIAKDTAGRSRPTPGTGAVAATAADVADLKDEQAAAFQRIVSVAA